jgi:hypothetical protein
LLVLLPVLMWAAAAIIGWSVVQGLLLRPLGQLQRSVAQLGTAPLALPRLQTPALEITALADSFRTPPNRSPRARSRWKRGSTARCG